MKNNFRITFYDGPEGNRSKTVDVYAESFDDARRQAWQMPEAKNRLYSDMMIEEIPKGPSVIGILYEYTDPYVSGKSTQPMFIKANDEAEAICYYNKHCLGTHFDFPNYRKNDENGRCTRGRIVETYFVAGAVNYDADATIENEKNKSVDNSNIVTIIYDLKTHRAQADDGVHGKAWVDFPNHLMSYDGQQYVVDALHWTGTKYTVSGNIKPMSNVKDDPRIDGWIAHRQVSNVILGCAEETVNQGQEQKSIDDVISQASDRSAATNIDKDSKIKATTIYFTTTEGEDATQFDTQDTAELLELFTQLLKENNLELVSVDGIEKCELVDELSDVAFNETDYVKE